MKQLDPESIKLENRRLKLNIQITMNMKRLDLKSIKLEND